MRSTFGELAETRRAELGLSLTGFAEKLGVSHARISQLEHQKAKISPQVLASYITALQLDESSATAVSLRESAKFSNQRLIFRQKEIRDDRLVAAVANYGHLLSDKDKNLILDRIQESIETAREADKSDSPIKKPHLDMIGLRRDRLLIPVNFKKNPAKRKRTNQLDPSTDRFVELVLESERLRAQYAKDHERLKVDFFVETECSRRTDLDIEICETMPTFAKGADAVIVGHPDGNTIFTEQGFYRKCAEGNYYFRHVILHDYSHHIWHRDLLETNGECYLEPHELARIGVVEEDANSTVAQGSLDEKREYHIPNTVELEAECFATLLLVPWLKMADASISPYEMKSFAVRLAKDFGAVSNVVLRVMRYLRTSSLRNGIKARLHAQGLTEHDFFGQP